VNILCCAVLLMLGARPATVSDGDFALSAFPVASIGDGPTVIRCELRYSGARPIRILWEQITPNLHVRLVSHPFAEVKVVTLAGSIESPELLVRPGAVLVEYQCIHQWGVSLNAKGEAAVVECRVRIPAVGRCEIATIAHPKMSMTIRPAGCGDEAMKVFSDNYSKLIRKPREPINQWREPTQWLDSVTNPAYLTLMIKVLDLAQSSDDDERCLQRIIGLRCPPAELTQRLAMGIAKEGLCGAQVFKLWSLKSLPSPNDREAAALFESLNQWTRTLACLTFRNTRESKSIERIAADLRNSYIDLGTTAAARFIRETDDQSYSVRERASNRLVTLGEYAEEPIRLAVAKGLTAESAARLSAVLKQIDAHKVHECDQAVRAIESLGSPESVKLLKLLSAEFPNPRVSKSARAALSRLEETRR
jgi:hypothetical protein